MMNFTSSVSELESLLLKYKTAEDFTSALKVSNILDIVYSGDQDLSKLTPSFRSLHLALHILENDLDGARYLWKRVPTVLKADSESELCRLWAVAKLLLTNDSTAALSALLAQGEAAWPMLGTDMINSVVSKLRNGIIGDIIKSYDSISLHGASTMMLLSADECKTELVARGCTYNGENDTLLTENASLQSNYAIDDGILLQTLTDCVAQLERQPLSVNLQSEIELAQNEISAKEKNDMVTAMET